VIRIEINGPAGQPIPMAFPLGPDAAVGFTAAAAGNGAPAAPPAAAAPGANADVAAAAGVSREMADMATALLGTLGVDAGTQHQLLNQFGGIMRALRQTSGAPLLFLVCFSPQDTPNLYSYWLTLFMSALAWAHVGLSVQFMSFHSLVAAVASLDVAGVSTEVAQTVARRVQDLGQQMRAVTQGDGARADSPATQQRQLVSDFLRALGPVVQGGCLASTTKHDCCRKNVRSMCAFVLGGLLACH
jgi:hypothetical protein